MHRLLFLAATFAFAAVAAPITYTVSVNTVSLAGATGSLDFNVNPGPLISQSAFVQILNFSGNGAVVGSPIITGDAAGSLPGTVTLDNGTGFNDYFQEFTYGSTLAFNVSLYGPALNAPNGASSSGSTFAFSMFSDAAGTMPALTTDATDGFAYLVDVNPDGSTTVTDYVVASSSAVPEPASWLLTSLALLITLFPSLHFRRPQ